MAGESQLKLNINMIIVWNCVHGELYGFKSLDAYKDYVLANADHSHWDDMVYDASVDGKCGDDKIIDMRAFNIMVTDKDKLTNY